MSTGQVRIYIKELLIDKIGRDDEAYITAQLYKPPGLSELEADPLGWLGCLCSPIIPIRDNDVHVFRGGYTLFQAKADALDSVMLYLSVWDSDEGQRKAGDTLKRTDESIQHVGTLINELGKSVSALNPYTGSANAVVQVATSLTSTFLMAQADDLRFADADSSHYVGFQAPATVSSSLTWTLPSADAAVSGYALVSDASGTLSWAAAGAGAQGAGSDNIFWENDQTVTQSYTITNGQNAGSFGPITIQSGVTVTVGAGETWTVV